MRDRHRRTIELNLENGGNRKFILVQLPEPVEEDSNAAKAGFATISEIGRERIRHAISKARKSSEGQLEFGHKGTGDLGFKSFRLDRSNFRIWDDLGDSADADELARQLELHVDHRRNESTPDDIVYEIIAEGRLPPFHEGGGDQARRFGRILHRRRRTAHLS